VNVVACLRVCVRAFVCVSLHALACVHLCACMCLYICVWACSLCACTRICVHVYRSQSLVTLTFTTGTCLCQGLPTCCIALLLGFHTGCCSCSNTHDGSGSRCQGLVLSLHCRQGQTLLVISMLQTNTVGGQGQQERHG